MKKIARAGNQGQTMILLVIFFLIFSLTAVFGIMSPVIRHLKATTNIVESKQGFFLAESGVEDVVYRLMKGFSTPLFSALSLGGETVNITVSDILGGKNIVAEGNSKNFIRKIEVDLANGIGVAFNYGVQTGIGGLSLSNNAGINGNVYSNGPITGGSGSFITASALSSNTASSSVVLENILPDPPPNQITFGNVSATEDVAQSFTLATTGPIGKIDVFIKKNGSPSNMTVKIVADNSGNPSGAVLSSAVLPATLVTTEFGWAELPMQSNADLVSGATYWLVLDAGSNPSKYYIWAANQALASNQAKLGQFGGSWSNTSPAGLDGYFKIYLGGTTGSITNVNVGTTSTAITHAHTVNNVTAAGNLYCQTGSGNNKSCDTSQADPQPLPFPISDSNIIQWKNQAESGTLISGNKLLDGGSSNLGKAKITGNLTLDNNHILTLTGTVWVMGNITIDNGSKIKLASSYGASSGAIVTDGKVIIKNGATFQGSGTGGSYVMLLTTSNCPSGASCGGSPAIDVGNNAGAVILNAQKGTIQFANNSAAKEATANLILLLNNAVINYESGLANINFSSGPSGGYDILMWKEVE